MIVQNLELAGETTGLPNGVVVTLDARGYVDVPDDCGIIQPDGSPAIPGWSLVQGTPRAQVLPQDPSTVPDGASVICIGPPDLAGQQTQCPDGRTTAHFSLNRMAVVPDTCGLDQLPGFRFVLPEEVPEIERQQAELLRSVAAPQLLDAAPVTAVPSPNRLEFVRSEAADTRPTNLIPTPAPAPPTAPAPAAPAARDTRELPLPNSGRPEGDSPEVNVPPLVPVGAPALAKSADPGAVANAAVVSQTNSAETVALPGNPHAQATVPAIQPVADPSVASPTAANNIEGAQVASSPYRCGECGRSDFKTQLGFNAHMAAHAKQLATVSTAPASAPAAAPVEPAPSAEPAAPSAAAQVAPAADSTPGNVNPEDQAAAAQAAVEAATAAAVASNP